MPILGKAAIAEAYRQSGDPQTALSLLDQTAHDIEVAPAGLRSWRVLRRLAIGYALLGDLEMAEYMMIQTVHDPSMLDNNWRAVAPAVACHDVGLALDLIADRVRANSEPYRNPEATVEVLIAAAASGHGATAYSFAAAEENLTERLLYLLAVRIGLLRAAEVPPDAIPCSTLNAIPQ
jgi:hypothetical protein